MTMRFDDFYQDDELTIEEALSLVMQVASEQGYVTYEDILTLLPEIEERMDLLEEILAQLQARDIPIYESAEEAQQVLEAEEEEDVLRWAVSPF